MTIRSLEQKAGAVVREIEQVIVGKRETVRLVLAAFLCNGHVLLDDIPGVGKTTLAKAIAKSIGTEFKRIQFTPDLLPADITGTSVFSQKTSEFEFRPGPIFANVVLADEINRATPKTLSSLLECMEELQVTVDGITHVVPKPFLVIATQNNIERRGSFPLPESQLDRFLMRLSMGYPDKKEEVTIIESQLSEHPIHNVQPILSRDEILELQAAVKEVRIDPCLRDYIVEIVSRTRDRSETELGASPRGSLGLVNAGRGIAALAGRDYVLPDDIKSIAVPVLAHRIIMRPEALVKGITAEKLVMEILHEIPVPVAYER
ncbi:MAG: MoxR family ATPase [Armatimonadota bacterium]|nr:MoxR family ATPase [Armatimonadota bacterium]